MTATDCLVRKVGEHVDHDPSATRGRLGSGRYRIETVCRVIKDLRPSVLEELGIWIALEWYAGQIEKQTGLSFLVTIDAPVAAMTLPGETNIALFRIVQEALTNAIRHAGASQITVRVRLDEDALIVEVADDGKGLEASHVFNGVSWGIAGMQERARHVGGRSRDHGYHRVRYGRRFALASGTRQ
jgi:signal transduction histidine kinase